jgi:hypothetical protein
VMSSLCHPNLVRLYGIVTNPSLGMVMELISHGDLHDLLNLKRKGTLKKNYMHPDLPGICTKKEGSKV